MCSLQTGQLYLLEDFSKCCRIHSKQKIWPHSVIYVATIHYDSERHIEHIISFCCVTMVCMTEDHSSSLMEFTNEFNYLEEGLA